MKAYQISVREPERFSDDELEQHINELGEIIRNHGGKPFGYCYLGADLLAVVPEWMASEDSELAKSYDLVLLPCAV